MLAVKKECFTAPPVMLNVFSYWCPSCSHSDQLLLAVSPVGQEAGVCSRLTVLVIASPAKASHHTRPTDQINSTHMLLKLVTQGQFRGWLSKPGIV